MKTIKFYSLPVEAGTACIHPNQLKTYGLDDQEFFEIGGKRTEVVCETPITEGNRMAVIREMQGMTPNGYGVDPSLQRVAWFMHAFKEWREFDKEGEHGKDLSQQFFAALPLTVATLLDNELQMLIDPVPADNADFFTRILEKRRQNSPPTTTETQETG